MSASNWTGCPKCIADAKTTVEAAEQRVSALYGEVSVESFDDARAALPTVAGLLKDQPTFREDYETYGAETGTVTYTYAGRCTVCNLKVETRDVQQFYPEAT